MLVNPHSPGCFWHKWAVKFGPPDIKYCEETLCQFITEPSNTWSNLLFIIIGLLITLKYKNLKGESVKFYGYNMQIVGIASLIYHLSNNFLTQFIDFLGMYSFFGLILFTHLESLKIFKRRVLLYFFISFIPFIISFFLLRKFGFPVQISIGVIILGCIFTKYLMAKKLNINYRYFFLSLIPFAIAFIFQIMDIKRIGCDPHNHILQFHALWHIFNAIGMGILFLHYKKIEDSL